MDSSLTDPADRRWVCVNTLDLALADARAAQLAASRRPTRYERRRAERKAQRAARRVQR